MKILSNATIVPIQLLGYFEGSQTTRSVSIILEGDETEDLVESICMNVANEIYYNSNKDPFGKEKTRRFTIKVFRKKLRVNTTLHFKAFVEVFNDELRLEIGRRNKTLTARKD